MRFVVDGMLGKLTRWLRMMGHDALYLNDAKDRDLVANAIQEKRILLTSDVALWRYAIVHGAEAFLVKGSTEAERLASLANRFKFELSVDTTESRCPACGFELKATPKEKVKSKVPETTFNVFDEFWACSNPECGKVYWQGSHWENINAILEKAKKIQTSDKESREDG